MSKIKKALLLALSMAMSATIFAACGGGDDDQSSSASSSSSSFEWSNLQSSSSNSFEWSSWQSSASSSSEVNSGSQGSESGSGEVNSGSQDGESSFSSAAGSESNSSSVASSESNSSGAAGSESNSSSVAGSESNSSGAAGSESTSSGNTSSESNSSVTPEVPEIPEVDGEQVADLDAWNAAWANTIAAKNIVAIYQDTYTFDGVTETEYGETLVADNKIYMCDYDDTNGNAYMYAGEVDGKTYQWESVDGENWVAEEILVDMDVMATGYLIVRGLNEALDFSTAVYENGYYVCTTEWATFNIKIAGGYVVEITMKDDTETMSYKMSFGNAVIGELPPLPQEEVIVGEAVKDAGEWDKILENTDNKTNFTYTAEGRMERDDGKVGIATEYVAVDNGKVYVEMEQRIYSGDGSSMGSENRYYQGVVNGVAYQWYYVGGGEFHAQEIEAVEGETIVALLDLQDLVFATATFDSVTGAYTFNADGATIAIKVVDSLVRYVELRTEAMYVEYTVSYDNANVELPPVGEIGGGEGSTEIEIDWNGPVGGDIIGEEVSEADFENAIVRSLKSDNFLVKGYVGSLSGSGETAVGYTQIADGKMYNYTSATYKEDGKEYNAEFSIYVGTVDGVEYMWYSEDGENYETGYAEEEGLVGCCNGSVFQMYFAFADYGVMQYDAETGAYVMQIPGEDAGETFSLKIVDGQVVYFCISTVDGDMEQTFVIEYGNAYVGALPPVGEIGGGESGGDKVEILLPLLEIDFDDTLMESIVGEQVTQDELREAIERTYAATNFVLRGDSYIEGGKSLYISHIADGKMRTLTQATYMEEGSGKLETTNMYQYSGNVDGTDYIWLSTDGEIWECALAEEVMVGSYGNGQEVFSSILDIFLLMDSSYNETSKEFYIDMSEAQGVFFSVRVVDGYIKTISMKFVDGMYMNYVVEYDCAEVGALPPVGEIGGGDVNIPENPDNEVDFSAIEFIFDLNVGVGIVGEEVSDDILKKAITEALGSTNFTFRGKSYVEGASSLIAANVANGKMAEMTKSTYPTTDGKYETTTLSTIIGDVNGTAYIWISFDDGNSWEYDLAENMVVGTGWRDGNEVLGMFLQPFLTMEYAFNANTGEYYISMEGATVAIKIVDNEVKAVYMTSGDMYVLYVIEYGNAVNVALPPVGEIGGGDVNIPENPDFDAMGQEVSQGEWEKAFYLFFNEQANVTVNSTFWMSMEEYYDETWHKYEGILDGVIYFSNGEMYERNQITEMEDGDRFSYTEEKYIVNKDGTYYEYYSDSIDTPNWVESTVRADEFNGRAALYILGEEDLLEAYIAMYAIADFNRETGEYTVYIEDEIDPYTMKFKFVDGLLFSLTIRFEDMESDSERGFVEERYVFTNYGNTYFEYPDFENGGGNFGGDEEVVVPEIELPYGEEVNAEVWEKAVADLKEANNFTANGTVTLATSVDSLTVAMNMHIAENKGFSVVTVNGREQYSVVGNVDGKNYEWYSEDGSYWECECTGDAYDIDGTYFWNDIVGVDVTYDSVYFDEENGGYVYEISEMAYVIIGFTDGQVSFIVSYTQEEYGIDSYAREKLVFVLSYGDAVVGELPPVENVVEDDVVIGGDEEMKEESMKA